MKCPNIYCVMQESGECISTDGACACKTKFEHDHCPTEEEYKRTEQKKYPLCDSCCKLTECIINGDIVTGEGVFKCDEYGPLF